ncbi:TPA: hypothetical protein ENX78_04860 [Candidatus Poribacteria bacterium]|nr:hypothetical protein [Candidatus Poribacteria bacterium]
MRSKEVKITMFTAFVIFTGLLAILVGCAKNNIYGEKVTVQSTTLIDDLIAKPQNFSGQTVKVEGQIIDECPGGHWFHLKGNKEIIYVTLSGFTLPQKVGKTVIVEGNLVDNNGTPALLGRGVEIK